VPAKVTAQEEIIGRARLSVRCQRRAPGHDITGKEHVDHQLLPGPLAVVRASCVHGGDRVA